MSLVPFACSRRFEAETFADELVPLWEKAKDMYARKLAKIPARVFPGGSKPTIHDIFQIPDIRYDCSINDLYTTYNVAYPANIPVRYAFDFVMEVFGDIESDGFKPRKIQDHQHVVGCVWYWQMDKCHSFSRKHSQVLANVIVASIVSAGPMDNKTAEWVDRLLCAFMNYNLRVGDTTETEEFLGLWWNSDWDLIKSGHTKMDKIRKKIREAKKKIPNAPFQTCEYPLLASKQDRTTFLKNAGLWAIWYYQELEEDYDGIDQGFKGDIAQKFLDSNNLVNAFGTSGVSDAMPDYVTHAHFDKPSVKALMYDIKENHEWKNIPSTADAARRKPWMPENDAMDLIHGNSLEMLISNLQL